MRGMNLRPCYRWSIKCEATFWHTNLEPIHRLRNMIGGTWGTPSRVLRANLRAHTVTASIRSGGPSELHKLTQLHLLLTAAFLKVKEVSISGCGRSRSPAAGKVMEENNVSWSRISILLDSFLSSSLCGTSYSENTEPVL
jgi:hypothetical protein